MSHTRSPPQPATPAVLMTPRLPSTPSTTASRHSRHPLLRRRVESKVEHELLRCGLRPLPAPTRESVPLVFAFI
eukprot:scaffold26294_cov112-Isochrysis_galbana.AAC.1